MKGRRRARSLVHAETRALRITLEQTIAEIESVRSDGRRTEDTVAPGGEELYLSFAFVMCRVSTRWRAHFEARALDLLAKRLARPSAVRGQA